MFETSLYPVHASNCVNIVDIYWSKGVGTPISILL